MNEKSYIFTTAYKFGIKIAFGTDSGVSYHGDNAKEFYYMVKGGMSEMEAIRSATVVASEMLKINRNINENTHTSTRLMSKIIHRNQIY